MNRQKHNKHTPLVRNQKGQVSIFLALLLIIIFSLVAFVTNVGLFVKAKINLQNAVDSAAWSGAAVQARQLSNIAYLNWEMRNTFKEWMFKYYVMGTISNERTHTANVDSYGGDAVDWRLKRFDPTSSTDQGDRYNFPTTCIHFGSSNNICNVYQIPGLPRFKVAGLPNVSEQFEAAVNSFVEQKAKNCSDRTSYNFAAAMNYAYSTRKQSLTDVPIVAAYRTGAWMEATELALRMRNLEMIVNRPPTGSICAQGCETSATELNSVNGSYGYAINERPLKAFIAAQKSLGGGIYKTLSTPQEYDLLAPAFKLTELSPKAYEAETGSLSNFLIPTDAVFSNLGQEIAVTKKHYVDLVPMIFNYVTFFTTFGPRTGDSGEILDEISGTAMEAACASTKTALPVPGYIMGFYKNPDVLTYYAVKGETKYMGLLNPFDTDGITLSAYAAAKPYGGRIGPALVMNHNKDDSANAKGNQARNSDGGQVGRTADFVIGFQSELDPRPVSAGGLPIPIDSNFYLRDETQIIGGTAAAVGSGDVKYAIPNMIYTYPSSASSLNSERIPKTKYRDTTTLASDMVKAGLFNKEQFKALRANLPSAAMTSATLDQASIEEAIANARGPTLYDAFNYLIPTVDGGSTDLDTMPIYKPLPSGGPQPMYGLFAPLYGAGTLYQNDTTLSSAINEYIDLLQPSVARYIDALGDYATELRNADSKYETAANLISESPVQVPPFADCTSVSVAAKFDFFFKSDTLGSPDNCDITPLKTAFKEYVVGIASAGGRDKFHITTYMQSADASRPNAVDNKQISTGYAPGVSQGADANGSVSGLSARRNFYSTKFIGMDTIMSNNGGYEGKWFYVENLSGTSPSNPTDFNDAQFKNFLNNGQLNEFGSDLEF